MVVVVWLWIVPLLTCWMWRLGFTTSFLHGWNTVSQRMSPLLLLADCIQVRTYAIVWSPGSPMRLQSCCCEEGARILRQRLLTGSHN